MGIPERTDLPVMEYFIPLVIDQKSVARGHAEKTHCMIIRK